MHEHKIVISMDGATAIKKNRASYLHKYRTSEAFLIVFKVQTIRNSLVHNFKPIRPLNDDSKTFVII